jgi:hypothetical protein
MDLSRPSRTEFYRAVRSDHPIDVWSATFKWFGSPLLHESSRVNSAVVKFSDMATCRAAVRLNKQNLRGRRVTIAWEEHLTPEELVVKSEREARLLAEANAKKEREARLLAEANLLLAEESDQVTKGTYFSSIEDVWQATRAKPTSKDFDDLFRKKPPSFKQRSSSDNVKGTAAYELTLSMATKPGTVSAASDPVPNDSTKSKQTNASSENSKAKMKKWPVDIFGKKTSADIAHLIPASVTNGSMYSDVVRWIFGSSAFSSDVAQKLIHGTRPSSNDPRIAHTGAVHLVSNKIRLNKQRAHFDTNPRVLIVPVLTVKQMKEWEGEAYDAIVLAGGNGDFSASEVYSDLHMNGGETSVATPVQVDTARKSLAAIVLGLMYSLNERTTILKSDLSDVSREILLGFQANTAPCIHGQGIAVPEAKSPTDQIRVCLIRFQGHSESGGHPAPDPMLLGVKAAVNWSRRNSEQMLAAAEPQDLEDDEDDSSEYYQRVEEADIIDKYISFPNPCTGMRRGGLV